MSVHTIPELLLHELGDMLFAERSILKALPKMVREVSNPDMRQRLEQHVGETEQQARNLELAFEALGERAKAQKCPGILGILKEHDEFKSDEAGSAPILEAFDLGAGLRVEHYEIAGYRSALALARNLGIPQVISLLQENLEQEVAMAEFIERSAAMALESARANADAAASRATTKRGATKRSAAKRATAKRGATKRSTSTRVATKRVATKRVSTKSGATKRTAKRATSKRGG